MLCRHKLHALTHTSLHFTSLLFVNATSQFCDILASRRSAVNYIDVKNLRKWLIPVSAVATACCGRAFQFIIVRGIKLNLKIFVRDEVLFMHVSSFPGGPNKGVQGQGSRVIKSLLEQAQSINLMSLLE